MAKLFAGIRTSGKKSEDHDDDEDEAKRAEEHENDEDEAKKAEEHENDEDEAKKAEEHDDDDEDEEESKSKKAARKAERKAERKARSDARQIVETCTLAGKPELAGEFLAKGVSLADVRKTLLKQQASESSASSIAGHTGPATSRSTVALWDKTVARVNGRFNPGPSA